MHIETLNEFEYKCTSKREHVLLCEKLPSQFADVDFSLASRLRLPSLVESKFLYLVIPSIFVRSAIQRRCPLPRRDTPVSCVCRRPANDMDFS